MRTDARKPCRPGERHTFDIGTARRGRGARVGRATYSDLVTEPNAGRLLREHRVRRALSQEDVARALARLSWQLDHRAAEVTGDTVSRWERGKVRPGPRYTRLLIHLFDATVDDLGLGLGAVSPGSSFPQAAPMTDPVIHDAWDELLDVLAVRSNELGCSDLRRSTAGQVRLIASARKAAIGPERRRLSATEARWTEFLSWVEANGRSPSRAGPLLDRAHGLAAEAEDQHLAAYILMRQSQQALDTGDALRAAGLAQRARRDPLPSPTTALCLVREAEAHALADDATACRQNIDLALRMISESRDATDPLGGHCTITYIRAHEARCRQVLGDSSAAIEAYEEIVTDLPDGGRLDEGLWRADWALAYLDDGEPERAAEEGLSALDAARSTSSARTLRAVERLLPRLRRHRALAAMPALADAYRDALQAVDARP